MFLVALVNVETASLFNLDELSNGDVVIQPECRCALDTPRNENANSTFCLANSPLPNAPMKQRLNVYAHPLDFANDGNFQTSWVSCILSLNQPIIVELDFSNGVYLVQRIEIFFASLPPTQLVIEKFLDNEWSQIQIFSINCNDNNASCIKLPKYSIYKKRIRKKIYI